MLSDWISVLQLSAAISLAFGAYDSTRKKREEQGFEILRSAEIKIKKLLPEDPQHWVYKIPHDFMLNDVGWKNMSPADLNDYRRDVRLRFETAVKAITKRDDLRTACFIVIGLVSVVLLIVASAFPRTEINVIVAILASILLLGIPVASILSIVLEERALARLLAPSDPSGKHGKSRPLYFRSVEQKGELYHVTNEIRRRRPEQ
jgi:hypothetical protein